MRWLAFFGGAALMGLGVILASAPASSLATFVGGTLVLLSFVVVSGGAWIADRSGCDAQLE